MAVARRMANKNLQGHFIQYLITTAGDSHILADKAMHPKEFMDLTKNQQLQVQNGANLG